MLEGLEISEVAFKKIVSTKLIRLEPEFYTAKSFGLSDPFSGEEIIEFVQYGTSKELNEEKQGYPILRLNEFDSFFISSPSKYCCIINKKTYESLQLLKDDVLICRTNGNYRYVGKSAIVPMSYEYAYASYLFKIRPKRNLINSSTLVAFLNSKYGRIEIEKHSMAGNQVNFSPAKFRQLRIPRFNSKLNETIERLTYLSFNDLESSKQTYTQAEQILLEEIGLQDFEPSQEPVNIKSFKDSFGTSGRLDAEYYQKKYDNFISVVHQYKHGFDKVSVCCDVKISNYKPDDNATYKYIELSNVGKSGDINGCTVGLGKELPSRARRKVVTGDVVISSIEGSLTSCALVTREYNDALCSTGFYVIQSSRINSETLLVLFKSKLMQNILKQNCSGTILTAVNKNEFLTIELPIIIKEKQQQIATLIQQSFSLKKQSEHLLDVAKRAVEIAIEDNEQVALDYIQHEVAAYES